MNNLENVDLSWLTTPENVVVNFDGETHLVPRSEVRADKLIELLKQENYEGIKALLDSSAMIADFSNGEFQVKNGVVYIDDFMLPDMLSRKILEFINEDLPYTPLVNFAKKLMNNPSNTSLNSLYRFLEHNNHPITSNGNFIAYKGIRANFTDTWTGKFDNSPGTTVEVPRNQVDENIDQTCSYGLHVANWDYANNIWRGEITIEVEVDPADVVAVPRDYNNSKMRVCKYVVRQAVKNPHKDSDLLYNDSGLPHNDSGLPHNDSLDEQYWEEELEEEWENEWEEDLEDNLDLENERGELNN